MRKKTEIEEVYNGISTLIEAAEFIKSSAFNDTQKNVFEDMIFFLNNIYEWIKQNEFEYDFIPNIESIKYSIFKAYNLYDRDSLYGKIEFELIPLLKEFKKLYYFWVIAYGNKELEKKYFDVEMKELCKNEYIERSEQTGSYKYDISIVVTAFNKLEYTKMCIDFLLKYIPKNLKYELILINHGSEDGTREYFHSLMPDKMLDIAINGGGSRAVHYILEGKYGLFISNDVLVTKNAIENMYKCISADSRRVMIVPATPNVSNLQSLQVNYNSFEELEKFVERNNVYDTRKHEERVRLCDPISLINNFVNINELCTHGYYIKIGLNAFPDDIRSLIYRRNGYKLILAKDSYCHHFGAITINDVGETKLTNLYKMGREEFQQNFGVDPWGVGFCYSTELIELIDFNNSKDVEILGINCGLGSNPLKIKELIKERNDNVNIRITNIIEKDSYFRDLLNSSDQVFLVQKIEDIKMYINNKSFDYILIEGISKNFNEEEILNWVSYLKKEGILLINSSNYDNTWKKYSKEM